MGGRVMPAILRTLSSLLLLAVPAAGVLLPAAPVGAVDDPVLVDRASAAGLAQSQRSWSNSTVDFNGDGLEEVLNVFHQYTDSWVYRNNGDGTFRQAFKIPRVNSQGGVFDRHDCEWYDVDGNGLPDAYCSGGRNQSNYVKTAEKDNELWLQLTPGQFTDRGTQWGVGDPCGRGRMVAFLDVNNDGWKDLFVGNQVGRPVSDPCDTAGTYLPEGSKVFLNNAGRSLTYSAQWSTFRGNAGVRCAVPLDYNRDGRMDLLACTFRNNLAQLYRNTGSGFADASAAVPIGKISDAAVGDLDSDGIPDLVMSDVNGLTYRRGLASGLGPSVRVWTAPSNADGLAVAIGDIQGDGLSDVYLVTDSTSSSTNPTDRLFVNHGGFSFVGLTPPAAGGMGDAVTAVDVYGDGRAQFVVLNGREKQVGPVQLIAAAP